jgi:hypothetical protein
MKKDKIILGIDTIGKHEPITEKELLLIDKLVAERKGVTVTDRIIKRSPRRLRRTLTNKF